MCAKMSLLIYFKFCNKDRLPNPKSLSTCSGTFKSDFTDPVNQKMQQTGTAIAKGIKPIKMRGP